MKIHSSRIIPCFLVVGISCLVGSINADAAGRRNKLTPNEEERVAAIKAGHHQTFEESWISRSDLIARGEVVGCDSVHRLKRSENPHERYELGLLVTFKVDKMLLQRCKSETNGTSLIYIYKEGLAIGDPYLQVGDSGVIFLRAASMPELATNGVAIAPKLPDGKYYDYALVRGGVSGMSAFLRSGQTNLVARFEKELQRVDNPKSMIRQKDPKAVVVINSP